MWSIGDDDEDALTKARSIMPYEWAKDLVVDGLPGAAGVDLTGSLAIEVPRGWKDLLGVPYSVIEDSINMVESWQSGAHFRALGETPFTPLALRNAMRGLELYGTGQRTRSGKDINYFGETGARKINTREAILKTLVGLQPVSVSKGYEAYKATKTMQEAIKRRKIKWADRYVNAMKNGDSKARDEVLKEVKEWNAKATKAKKFYRIIDLRKAIEYRLRPNSKAVPKKMRARAKIIAKQWGAQQ